MNLAQLARLKEIEVKELEKDETSEVIIASVEKNNREFEKNI
jgi:hypothetical protein